MELFLFELFVFFSRTMKKWIVLLGGAMFCVLFLSMYLVVDQLGRLPTSQEIFKVEVTCIRGRSRASISPAFINSLLGKLNILEALISSL